MESNQSLVFHEHFPVSFSAGADCEKLGSLNSIKNVTTIIITRIPENGEKFSSLRVRFSRLSLALMCSRQSFPELSSFIEYKTIFLHSVRRHSVGFLTKIWQKIDAGNRSRRYIYFLSRVLHFNDDNNTRPHDKHLTSFSATIISYSFAGERIVFLWHSRLRCELT